MTVKELIARLQEEGSDAIVMTLGRTDGYIPLGELGRGRYFPRAERYVDEEWKAGAKWVRIRHIWKTGAANVEENE